MLVETFVHQKLDEAFYLVNIALRRIDLTPATIISTLLISPTYRGFNSFLFKRLEMIRKIIPSERKKQ